MIKLDKEAQPLDRSKLKALRTRFEEDHLPNYFDSPGDLAMKVMAAMLPYVIAENFRGLESPLRSLAQAHKLLRAAELTLSMSPAAVVADGLSSAVVTATVADFDGNLLDNEPIVFSAIAAAVVNPVFTETLDGAASCVVTPLSAPATQRVTVVCLAISSGLVRTIDLDLLPA